MTSVGDEESTQVWQQTRLVGHLHQLLQSDNIHIQFPWQDVLQDGVSCMNTWLEVYSKQ